MRLVLDTNVVVSGLLWDGSPRQLLKTGSHEGIRFFTSAQLLAELSRTLFYEKLRGKIAASGFSVEQLVDRYSKLASVVMPSAVPRFAPDPDDDVVIGTALAAKAALIVTGDKSLLSVGEYEGGRIVTVGEALGAIGEAALREDL